MIFQSKVLYFSIIANIFSIGKGRDLCNIMYINKLQNID